MRVEVVVVRRLGRVGDHQEGSPLKENDFVGVGDLAEVIELGFEELDVGY